MATVPVAIERESTDVVFGSMDQPVPTSAPYPDPDRLLDALGVASSGLPIEAYTNGPRHVYVELGSEDAVRAVTPDLVALEALGEHGTSCFAGSEGRWKTRMFAPALGVPEDAATGSAADRDQPRSGDRQAVDSVRERARYGRQDRARGGRGICRSRCRRPLQAGLTTFQPGRTSSKARTSGRMLWSERRRIR